MRARSSARKNQKSFCLPFYLTFDTSISPPHNLHFFIALQEDLSLTLLDCVTQQNCLYNVFGEQIVPICGELNYACNCQSSQLNSVYGCCLDTCDEIDQQGISTLYYTKILSHPFHPSFIFAAFARRLTKDIVYRSWLDLRYRLLQLL